MSVNDPIADMLTRIRNANLAGLETVQMPHSNMKGEIARLLKREGYLKDYVTEGQGGKRVLRLYLKFGPDRTPLIQGLRRISKPGLRRYVRGDKVPYVRGGMGLVILSTSGGLCTGRDARKNGVGGEVLCYVW
jgi:small subunit ribosomal protein S8